MSDHHTLVTYPCLHFAIYPTSSILNLKGTTVQLCRPTQAQLDLRVEVTTHHLSVPVHCEDFACNHLTIAEWAARTSSALSSLQTSLKSFRNGIMQLAVVYHSIPLDTRVALSSDIICELAHQQFGIGKCTWEEDPYFQPYVEAKELIGEIKTSVACSVWTEDALVQAAGKINYCRGLVVKLRGFEDEIKEGVRKLHRVCTGKMNEKLEAAESNPGTGRRRAMNAEAGRRRDSATVQKEEQSQVDRVTILQQDLTQKPSKRAFCKDLIIRIKEKTKTKRRRLSNASKGSPEPRDKTKGSNSQSSLFTGAKAQSRVICDAKPESERKSCRAGQSRRREKSRSAGAERKKDVFSSALQVNFIDRMGGF